MHYYKGIFWYIPNEHKLIAIKTVCDENGYTLDDVKYSSKSGENFNHKNDWSKLHKSITDNKPYNYYPLV